jgi:hypothetical protein
MDPAKSTYVMILSLDMVVLGKFSLGSYVPGSKNVKYELHFDLESGNSLAFERIAGGGVASIPPSVRPSTEEQGAGDDKGVAPISSPNLCAGDTTPAPTPNTPTATTLCNLSFRFEGTSKA